MGKKSRSRQRRARQRQKFADASPEALRKTVLEHLERTREREAVKAAKALCKAAPGPESEELLLRARLARAEALLRSGAAADARQLLDDLTSGQHRMGDRIALLRARIDAHLGHFDSILADISNGEGSAELQDPLLHILRDHVTDPRVIANSTVLPADHPLRLEARAADRFFRASVEGPLAPEDQEVASQVPRRSPLAPFVLAGHAVQAAYRGDDESIDRLARLMPENSAPARLIPVLHAIAGGDRSAAASPPERRLLEAVEGGTARLRRDLLALEEAFETGRIEPVVSLSRRILLEFRENAPDLAPEFLLFLAVEFPFTQLFFEPIGKLIAEHAGSRAEELRILALSAEHGGAPEEAIQRWDEFLAAREPPVDPRDTALVLMRQAECAKMVKERQGRCSCGNPDCPGGDPWDDDWDDEWDDGCGDEWDEDWDESSSDQEEVVATDPARYLEAAAEIWPSTHTWAALLEEYADSDQEAEATAIRWHEADPLALPPLLHLLQATEKRGAVRKALRWLEKAEALEPGHVEVRAGRFRLLLAGAAHRIRKGIFRLAREDVAELEKTPHGKDPQFRVLLAALRFFVAEDENGRGAAMSVLEEELEKTGAAFFLRRVREALRAERTIPAISRGGGKPSPELAALVLARASRVFDAASWPLVPEPAWVEALLRGLKADLEPATKDLEALCRLATELVELEILYRLAGRGLRRPGPGRYRFLLHRARALRRASEMDRRERCLGAVLTLARQVGDRETDTEARREFGLPPDLRDFMRVGGIDLHFFQKLAGQTAEPLPTSEVADVLEFEANTPFGGKRARRRSRKSRKDFPTLFDL